MKASPETLTPECTAWVLQTTDARSLGSVRLLQPLWRGLGSLYRLELVGASRPSVVLKYVSPPAVAQLSPAEARKRRSYEVEQRWYERYAPECGDRSRVARGLGSTAFGNALVLLLEDLGSAGFLPQRPPNERQLRSGLQWLAAFHAQFFGRSSADLWPRGTYWELDYRLTELERTAHPWFRQRARQLDEALKQAQYETFVHGDAKAANFLWHGTDRVAVVDFQWVGGGCGVRDLALLLDRCLEEEGCLVQADRWLDFYFHLLRQELEARGRSVPFEAVEAEWRRLFPIAWCDHERLWFGWGRGEYRVGPYTERMMELTERALG